MTLSTTCGGCRDPAASAYEAGGALTHLVVPGDRASRCPTCSANSEGAPIGKSCARLGAGEACGVYDLWGESQMNLETRDADIATVSEAHLGFSSIVCRRHCRVDDALQFIEFRLAQRRFDL